MEGYCSLPPSLPRRSSSGAARRLSPSAAVQQSSAHFADSSESHQRLQTKQQSLELFFPSCQKPYVPCQDVTRNTSRYRHTSLTLTQSSGTFAAAAHVISTLMHQGKASASQRGVSAQVVGFFSSGFIQAEYFGGGGCLQFFSRSRNVLQWQINDVSSHETHCKPMATRSNRATSAVAPTQGGPKQPASECHL